MTNQDMKRSSAWLVIGKLQIKITMRDNFIPTRKAVILIVIKWKIRSVVEDEEKLAPSCFASGNMYIGPTDMESS